MIRLNPDGRKQTKKWRPILRETKCLAAWLDRWEKDAAAEGRTLDTYVGYASVDSLQSAITRARRAPNPALDRAGADLPRMVAYSFRHKMTTVLRRYAVPSDQINVQLGHKRPSNRTSDLYGEYEPSYLAEAADALDAYMVRLQALTKRRLFVGDSVASANIVNLKG